MKRMIGVFLGVILSVMLLTVVFGCGQTWTVSAIGGWSKTYGGTGDDYAFALVQTVDGGYALAGYTNSFGGGGSNFWLVKTDADGVVPEFPSHVILAALLVVTSSAVILSKRKFRGNPRKPC